MRDSLHDDSIILDGTPASSGIAIGKIKLVSHRDLEIPAGLISNDLISEHVKRVKSVMNSVADQLRTLKKRQSNDELQAILEAQVEIVKDPELVKRVEYFIRTEKRSAEYALYIAFNEYIQILRKSGQDWIKDRIIDLQSLRDKIIHQISGSDVIRSDAKGVILFAEELSSAEMIEYGESGIAAIVMQHGGTTSHAVIIAQSLGIPCVVGVEWRHSYLEDEPLAAVDAESGEVVINPGEATLKKYRSKLDTMESEERLSVARGSQANITSCGTPFSIRANIEFDMELVRVKEYSAEGVGLLRTETLFLRQGYFDIEEHIRLYRSVLAATCEYPVTIRLLDIGGDKLPGSFITEPNPFLGWRGIRMLLEERELLDSQLKAVLTVAGEYPGRVQILLPMVTDISELITIKKSIDLMKGQLCDKGLDIGEDIPVGIMVEVPAIALQAEKAAEIADFFSIGSNDLTQYVLAADRGNEKVSSYFRSAHPAVWKLIKVSFDAAKKAGIPISVCGEMAGNPLLAAGLLGMGIRELSMNPSSIPGVKKVLCNFELSLFEELFHSLMVTSDGEETDRLLSAWKSKILN